MLGCVLLTACGGGGGDTNQPPEQHYEPVSGNERIGWRQPAPSLDEANSFVYVMYVDGVGEPLSWGPCTPVAQEMFDCSARLPRLSVGRHKLELAASNPSGESPRSDPIYVEVTSTLTSNLAASTAQQTDSPAGLEFAACTENKELCLSAETLVPNLPGARRLTALPDGRMLVISGADRVVAVENGRLIPVAVDPPCRPPAESRLSDLAVSPDFSNDRLVFAAWTCDAPGSPPQLLLASYRELGDSLGEPRIAELMAVSDPLVTVQVGPAQRVYLSAQQYSRWNLYETAPFDSQSPEAPVTVTALNSAAAMVSYGQRVLVFTEDRLMTFAPLARRGRTSLRRVFAETTTTSPQSIAIAVQEDSIGASDDTIWLARGREIRRLSPATAVESPGVWLPGQVLDLDTLAGGLYALVAFDADGGTRLVRLSADAIGRSVH